MKKTIALIILFSIAFTNQGISQSLNNLKEINKVWEKFYQAFDSLDHKPMAEIHSKKLMRITGNTIRDYKTYIDGYNATFKNARKIGMSNTISLRFFERINNDSIASENLAVQQNAARIGATTEEIQAALEKNGYIDFSKSHLKIPAKPEHYMVCT